jgi:protein PhnA
LQADLDASIEKATIAPNRTVSIPLVDGDHEIDCRIDGSAMALNACFVKKA